MNDCPCGQHAVCRNRCPTCYKRALKDPALRAALPKSRMHEGYRCGVKPAAPICPNTGKFWGPCSLCGGKHRTRGRRGSLPRPAKNRPIQGSPLFMAIESMRRQMDRTLAGEVE